MPLPFFWICMGITTVTIGAIVAYEAHSRYLHFREQQEYERYARQFAANNPPPPPPPSNEREFKESHSDDEDDKDKDDESNIKHFVRDLNDNSELRRRVPRAKSPSLTTNDHHAANNRPVSDKSWVDDTEYELNEMEQRLTMKKQYIERQQELLNKAEMDLERRWQLHQSRSSDLIEHMSTTSYASDHQQRDTTKDASTSSSYLSMNASTQKSTDHELTKGSASLISIQSNASSSNDHVTAVSSITPSEIQCNSSMDESMERLTPTTGDYKCQGQPSNSLDNSSSSSLQSDIVTDNNATAPSTSSPIQQQTPDSTIELNAENPWSFDDDDDDDDDRDNDNDEARLTVSFQHVMQFPSSSNSSNNINPSSASDSQRDFTDWDEHSLTNDMVSLSSHATQSSLADREANSLLSPSAPSSSSSDGGSYDLIHGSDLENGS